MPNGFFIGRLTVKAGGYFFRTSTDNKFSTYLEKLLKLFANTPGLNKKFVCNPIFFN